LFSNYLFLLDAVGICHQNEIAILAENIKAVVKRKNKKIKRKTNQSIDRLSRQISRFERLTNLAILSIENDVANELDYNELIADFASIKARKICL
jgi:DNA integrity scanning protein DisA with diadenylate cyclase activity